MSQRALRVEQGNAWEVSAKNADGMPNGWFMGSKKFIPDGTLRQSEDVELKWSVIPKGTKSAPRKCSPFKGITILLSGHFTIQFRDQAGDSWTGYEMTQPGDFIISHGGLEHFDFANEDSVLLTVRITPQQSVE